MRFHNLTIKTKIHINYIYIFIVWAWPGYNNNNNNKNHSTVIMSTILELLEVLEIAGCEKQPANILIRIERTMAKSNFC